MLSTHLNCFEAYHCGTCRLKCLSGTVVVLQLDVISVNSSVMIN